jgi:hypothetical protein
MEDSTSPNRRRGHAKGMKTCFDLRNGSKQKQTSTAICVFSVMIAQVTVSGVGDEIAAK